MNELTRAELIEMICPTDATYDCNQGNCSSSCDKCGDILNYLLDKYDAKVRADAIDECIRITNECCWKDAKMLVELFEQMKEEKHE